jgi:hypothetical protein
VGHATQVYGLQGIRISLAASMAEMETGDIRRIQDFHHFPH